jgi:hypothetical protein
MWRPQIDTTACRRIAVRVASLASLSAIALSITSARIEAAGAATPEKASLRGQTWDSIKSMPDWSGMWTPGARAPGGLDKDGKPFPRESGAFGTRLPFRPMYQAWADARMLRVRGEGKGGVEDIPLSNSGFCIPAGMPSTMGLVSHEYVFQPGRVLILLENSEIRRIWTDGRGHPADDESNPSFEGHSIGHWEGDALVVDTRQIYPEAELFFGLTVTDKAVIRERITLADKNTLRIDTVVEDDELFTEPWRYTRYFGREYRESVPYESCTLSDRAQLQGDKLVGLDFETQRLGPVERQRREAQKAYAEQQAAAAGKKESK